MPADEQLGYVLSEPHKRRIEDFAAAKGPDFISRLRAYINVPGSNAEPGRRKHFIRRAIQLRGLLEKLQFISNQRKIAKVEEPIIYALLTVDHYHHGVRSMEALLRMCRPIDGWIRVSSLPAPAQLDMHVDAEEFLIRLHRGRARMDNWLSSDLKERIEELVKGSPDGISGAVKAVAERLSSNADCESLSNVYAKVEVLEAILKEAKSYPPVQPGPSTPPPSDGPAEEADAAKRTRPGADRRQRSLLLPVAGGRKRKEGPATAPAAVATRPRKKA